MRSKKEVLDKVIVVQIWVKLHQFNDDQHAFEVNSSSELQDLNSISHSFHLS
jgi:hypothetical protein